MTNKYTEYASKKYVNDKTEILPVKNEYVIFEDAVPRLMKDTATYGTDVGVDTNNIYIFDNLQNTDMIVRAARFNLIISFNDGTEDITENIIVDVDKQTGFLKYVNDYSVNLDYDADMNLIAVSVTKEIETDDGYEEIPCTVTKATFICILYSNLLSSNIIKDIKYEQIVQVPNTLDGLVDGRYEVLNNDEYYYLYDNSFVWDMNRINERLDENSGVTQNTSVDTVARRVIAVNQKDSEGIGFGQLVPINNKRKVCIFANADADVIVKVYNPNTKELMLTMNFDTNNSFEFTKDYLQLYQLIGINNIFIAFTIKDTPSGYELKNKVRNLIVTDEYTFLKKEEVLTKANTKEYEPTGDYNPATKKYVDDKVPHYNETLMFEISGADFKSLMTNDYFNINALNIDETKSHIIKVKMDINSDEENIRKLVYDKTNNALIDEISQMYIYNHKSYDGTNFIEDENSAVITLGITTFGTGGGTEEADGYFRLYEIDKVELDSNCLSDDVIIKNSLTVGSRMGDIGEFSVAEGINTIASGYVSHAEGINTTASEQSSHAEGINTTASYYNAHAEGNNTTASGNASHAEGGYTTASGVDSHAEGESSNSINSVISDFSPSTSNDVILTAWNENSFSLAKGTSSHVEGKDNLALGDYSHAEGNYTIAIGVASHVEGLVSRADGGYSHAEGNATTADGMCSHAEGDNTIASSENQHVQGKYNIEDTENKYAHIVGNGKYNYNTDEIIRSNAHTLDWNGNAWYAGKLSQDGTPTEDKDLTTKKYVDDKVAGIVDSAPETLDTLKELSAALGNDANFAATVSTQIGNKVDKVDGKGLSTNDLTTNLKNNYDAAYTHSTSTHAPSNAQKNSDITKAEIEAKLIGDISSHTHSQYLTSVPAEYITEAELNAKGYAPLDSPNFTNSISMARKSDTTIGAQSVALGYNTTASGDISHAEGNLTTASGEVSHAEGYNTTASGFASHAEGNLTTASGDISHAEGINTIASGEASHAEGGNTTASGAGSHAEGGGTIASSESQHVEGRYNIEDTENKYAHIVGNGTADNARSNAHTLDWNGNAWYQGKLSQEGTPTEDKDLTTKKYVDNKVPHYNETLMFEISGEDFKSFANNSYFNINALNLDETKSYVGKEKYDINSTEESIYRFVYDKENDILIDNDSQLYIYNHKSYDGTNFTEDENSAVITLNITPMDLVVEGNGCFKLYEVEKLELDTNCLSDNVSIVNSLTVGDRKGDIGIYSVVEGNENTASGIFSHAEGVYTTASGDYSHAEGGSTIASGNGSHAEGVDTRAGSYASHVEGNYTIASSDYQHVQGKYNIEDTKNKYAHIVGNGTSSDARSNAHTLDWNGNGWYKGKLSQDGVPTEDKDLVTKKYVNDLIASSGAQIEETDLDTILTDIYGFTDTTE